ncbi:nucleoside diphosphate-linked moiety X motif 8-like isoform X2 [Mizuhopecten yessoensis]|uniref:nucleoside diphosphate-linked moiety X motif 8-like isoform X2 n=1 Tax=Mizuhopecten yessoensis TaxID=6573 RepID=UPI000B45BF57|nr:nucleoside diphosphate-linked moiety X motif 8-like isoform X2 [Mizuhopecten yessoensis]
MYVVGSSYRLVSPLWKNILSKSKLGQHQKWKNIFTTVSPKRLLSNSRHHTSTLTTDLFPGKMSSFKIPKNICRMHMLAIGCALSQKSSFLECSYDTKNQLRSYSDNRTSTVVNTQNIFSEENKCRVQRKLLTVKPVKRVVPQHENPKDAAVLIPLCYVNNEPSLLFMVRSWKVPVHKGEVCFPGGMKDATDLDLSQTALRETFEEMGLPMERVSLWGNMPKVPSKDGKIQVTPYLGFCGDMDLSKLALDESEVDAVFTRTLASLCDPGNVGSTQFRAGFTLPVFLGGELRIWGMTAILLHQALTILAPGMYNYKLRHVRPMQPS